MTTNQAVMYSVSMPSGDFYLQVSHPDAKLIQMVTIYGFDPTEWYNHGGRT